MPFKSLQLTLLLSTNNLTVGGGNWSGRGRIQTVLILLWGGWSAVPLKLKQSMSCHICVNQRSTTNKAGQPEGFPVGPGGLGLTVSQCMLKKTRAEVIMRAVHSVNMQYVVKAVNNVNHDPQSVLRIRFILQ